MSIQHPSNQHPSNQHPSNQPSSDDMHVLEVVSPPIELYKVLKIENLVSGGGEAKMLIAEGYVLLNGEVETRKRKKVFDGDIVEFNGEQVLIKGVDAADAGEFAAVKPNKKKARKAPQF